MVDLFTRLRRAHMHPTENVKTSTLPSSLEIRVQILVLKSVGPLVGSGTNTAQATRSMLTEMPQMMPVKVEIPVNHESIRQLPESIRQRLDETPKSAEEIAADSARNTERSSRLREQHIAAVKERAARETQRGEEAAAALRLQGQGVGGAGTGGARGVPRGGEGEACG